QTALNHYSEVRDRGHGTLNQLLALIGIEQSRPFPRIRGDHHPEPVDLHRGILDDANMAKMDRVEGPGVYTRPHNNNVAPRRSRPLDRSHGWRRTPSTSKDHDCPLWPVRSEERSPDMFAVFSTNDGGHLTRRRSPRPATPSSAGQ